MKRGLIIFAIIAGIIILSYEKPYREIKTARKEIISKKNIVRNNKINSIIYNRKLLNIETQNAVKIIIESFELRKGNNVILKKENFEIANGYLEIITNENKKVEFEFYFSKDCSDNTVLTNNGMLSADVKELCEILTH